MSVKNILDQNPASATFGKISRTYLPSAPGFDSQIYTVSGTVASANTNALASGATTQLFKANLPLPQLPYNANYTKIGILIQASTQGGVLTMTPTVATLYPLDSAPFVVGWNSSVSTAGALYATNTPAASPSITGSLVAFRGAADGVGTNTPQVRGNLLIQDQINMPVGGLTGGTFNLQLYLGTPNLPATGDTFASISILAQTITYTVSAWYVA